VGAALVGKGVSATRVCVLRSGGEYGPEHVRWLARQVPGLVCLSDVPVPGVETAPLKHGWPGWWSKLELFGPAIDGDILYFDLDTVVLKPPELPGRTTVLRDFYFPRLMNSSLMYVAQADKAAIWEAFIKSPEQHMARCTTRTCWGDQGFLQDHIGTAPKWQDGGARVYSYKVHCRHGLPADADVVCFHGQPRPWSSGAAWVPPLKQGSQ